MLKFFRRVRQVFSAPRKEALVYVGRYRGGGNDHEPCVQEVVDDTVQEGEEVHVYVKLRAAHE